MRQQEVNMKISTEVIIALLASFAISVVLSPIIIPFLKRLKIRSDGTNRRCTVPS